MYGAWYAGIWARKQDTVSKIVQDKSFCGNEVVHAITIGTQEQEKKKSKVHDTELFEINSLRTIVQYIFI